MKKLVKLTAIVLVALMAMPSIATLKKRKKETILKQYRDTPHSELPIPILSELWKDPGLIY